MISLSVGILFLIFLYFTQSFSPLMAGLLAIIPIKILSLIFMTYETSGGEAVKQAIVGMVIGQWVISVLLLMAYWWLDGR